jgi:glycosyltransferase involved in cell wall biosynthesis
MMVKISVGIKALNEEARIAGSLESALAAVEPFGGEVILADCGSVDRTVEIAGNYPVKIVQLAPSEPPSCGAGAQLAFQHAAGEYFYILDGDQVLKPEFIRAGISYLESHADVAGIGGLVRECNAEQPEFEIRAKSAAEGRSFDPRFTDRLNCGGLYRSAAVRELGYFADRNLHSFEEFETGARLLARKWKLVRVDLPAVDHYGHVEGGYRLLWRRLRSGYAGGAGEVLRASINQDHFRIVLSRLAHVRHSAIVILWWALLVTSALEGWIIILAMLVLAPVLFLSVRRRSLRLGLYSLAAWNITACGFIMGFFRKRTPARRPLQSVDLTGPAESLDKERFA